MGHWARTPHDPDQTLLFYPTVRECVPPDHPALLVDEVLEEYDWSSWEQGYVLCVGQPPIPPRYIAGPMVYGMSLGIRSSRRLEDACRTRIDFMLLSRGHCPDHSTFAKFRTDHREGIRELFRFVGMLSIRMGLACLNLVGLDGTRVRANSSRHGTASAARLEERLAELDRQVSELLSLADAQDREEATLFGKEATPHRLSKDLASLKRRQEKLAEALAKARAHEAKSKDGSSSKNKKGNKHTKAPKVPVADPDATIQPNKDGGFAPNYTPLGAVDGQGGLILDADVVPDSDEGQATVETLDRIEEAYGERPEEVVADSKHGSGANLAALAEREIEAYIPLEGRRDSPDNPAHREDPRQPVPEADWPRLPRSPVNRKLDRAAFVYDEAGDRYYCPMGHQVTLWRQTKKKEKNSTVSCRVYRCEHCGGCPLAGECVTAKDGRRTVSRDEHEHLREAMDARMRTPKGRGTYKRRKWICETPFGVLKTVMQVHQFLLRGLEKVRTEWVWACTAYNVRKLVRAIARMRGYRWAAT
jgi:transposase